MAVLNTLTVELLGGVNAMVGLVFRKCGEKSKTSEHNPIFANKTAGRGSLKQIPEPSSTLPFSRKETAGRSVVAFWCGRHV